MIVIGIISPLYTFIHPALRHRFHIMQFETLSPHAIHMGTAPCKHHMITSILEDPGYHQGANRMRKTVAVQENENSLVPSIVSRRQPIELLAPIQEFLREM